MSAPPTAPFPFARATLVWAALCALLILTKLDAIIHYKLPDPDDTLRLVQVRDLLGGQGWFDLHQYRIDPPHGTLMHWSRLVDLPLAAVIVTLTPVLGAPAAELSALIGVPLLTLGVVLLVVARIASRFFDTEVMTLACLSLGLAPLLVAQLQPMRIDHHGWQIACVMLALLGLLPGKGWRGAAACGLALAFALSISLEPLPLAAGFGAVFAWRWLFARDDRSLPAFLVALAGGLALLFLATRGFADLAVHCDAMSPAHLALFAVTAALTLAAARLRPRGTVLLVGALGVCAAAGVAVFLALAPECAAGPFSSLDPLTRRMWYDNVQEGLPVWQWKPTLALPVVLAGAAALGALAHLARTRPVQERGWWREYLMVTAAAFVAGLLVGRSQSFVGALSAVPLGWLTLRLLERLRSAPTAVRRLGAGVTVVLVLLPSFPAAVADAIAPVDTRPEANVRTVAESACDFPNSMPRLDRLPGGTVFAPLDVGPSVIQMSRHSVVATGHHRAARAIHDVEEAFISPPGRAHQLIEAHRAGYVMMCTDLAEPYVFEKEAPDGFAAQLLSSRVPSWLEPVDVGAPRALKLWRVTR
jgi:hypothetical protein